MIVEISEHDAKGDIALCYAEIRERFDLPVVNLIWRHLAALGHLQQSWQCVKDRLPELNAQAADLNHTALVLATACPPLPSLPFSEGVERILTTYERGNSLNLAMVRMLLGCNHKQGAGGTLPDAPSYVPPVPRFAELPAEMCEIIDRLAAAGPGADTGIRPTLWVHLTLEPNFLRTAEQPITQLITHSDFWAAHSQLTTLPSQAMELNLPIIMEHALNKFQRRISEMLLTGLCLARCWQASMEKT